ncbi:hypothetical protein ACHAXS_007636 [Conticribra weissflogii]
MASKPAILFCLLSSLHFAMAFQHQWRRIVKRGSATLYRSQQATRQFQSASTAKQYEEIASCDHNNEVNPLGPPTFVTRLVVGETLNTPINDMSITRLSTQPHIFLVKNFLPFENDRDTIMYRALQQGMKIAGTKKSGDNTVRTHSYLTWIDGANCEDEHATVIIKDMDVRARYFFVHDSINNMLIQSSNDQVDIRDVMEFCYTEDLQVAKYDTGGKFDYHHDGFSRYLTILVYLNGVGGTYFPYGGDIYDLEGQLDDEESVVVKAKGKMPGRDGILVVGSEGIDEYVSASNAVNPESIVEIQSGDAIAFYNYKSNGEKDWKSLHSSLVVPREKWIATCWFRSEALTGPFGWLHKEKLLEYSS